MRVLFPNPTWVISEVVPDDFRPELDDEVARVEPEFEIREQNFGHGADWPLYLVTFTTLFLLGKPLNENLDAWVKIGQRMRRFLGWLRGKKLGFWVDDEVSALLALDAIREGQGERMRNAELLQSSFVPAAHVAKANRQPPDFQPLGIHVHTFRIDEAIVVTVVSSSGEVEAIVPVTIPNPFVPFG